MKNVIDIIEPYDAGVFPDELSAKLKCVNLNSNENPFPLPEILVGRGYRELKNANRYPNPKYPELKDAISEYLGVPQENISIGCGASEILSNIVRVFVEPLDICVIPVPTYSMYQLYAMIESATIRFLKLKEPEFEVKKEEIIRESKDAGLIFICTPNNPTGKIVKRKDILEIAESTKAVVVIDEAYAEFCEKSVVKDAVEYENMIVVRSMSKFFSIASLRVGYAISSEKITNAIEKIRLPFAISSIAEKIAISAIKNVRIFKKRAEKIIREKDMLYQELSKIDGVYALKSYSNFILLRVPSGNISKKLISDGIIVRDVSNIVGIPNTYIRVTVGNREENMRFIESLKNILEEES